jgi:hypothetical protein
MSLSARLPDWRRGIAALIVAAGLLPPAPAAAQVDSDDTSDQKRVLVIHSTRRDSLIAEAAERVLAQEFDTAFGVRVDYYSEFIDPARFPDTSYASFIEVVVTATSILMSSLRSKKPRSASSPNSDTSCLQTHPSFSSRATPPRRARPIQRG